MADTPRTVVFFPEGAFGPTNNCVGIANVLRQRGHRVVFVVEESFKGTLEAKGFQEAHMRLGPPPAEPEVPGQFWKDFIRDTAPEFRKPTIEQLETFMAPTWQALVDGSMYVDDRLREIFDETRPDVIVQDNVVAFPAVAASGRPWVRIMSCNPLEMPDQAIPPAYSGYPADDRSGWEAFRAEHRRTHGPVWEPFDAFVRERGAPPLPDLQFIHESPFLNLYVYPEETDYARSRPLGPAWHRLGACVRETDEAFDWPEGFEPHAMGAPDHAGPLVYLSLGSLGSADVDLMDRLLGLLAGSPYRVIVSKGPQANLVKLPDGMWGREFLPQTRIVPHVDLVITHGGNNTVTECFPAGAPMVVLPLFWDQYDNAQRVDELGFGARLDPYRCTREELLGAMARLLGDQDLRARLAGASARLRADPGTLRAADLIERVAVEAAPVP